MQKDLTFKNARTGEFSNGHFMVDVYYKDQFISTYQYNPCYQIIEEARACVDDKGKVKIHPFATKLRNALAKIDVGRKPESFYFKNTGEDLKFNLQKLLKYITGTMSFGSNFKDDFIAESRDVLLSLNLPELMPDPYQVEGSLVLDVQCIWGCGPTFEDFCDCYGYDTDSRKAEETWNNVKDLYIKLSSMLGLDKLQELYEKHVED